MYFMIFLLLSSEIFFNGHLSSIFLVTQSFNLFDNSVVLRVTIVAVLDFGLFVLLAGVFEHIALIFLDMPGKVPSALHFEAPDGLVPEQQMFDVLTLFRVVAEYLQDVVSMPLIFQANLLEVNIVVPKFPLDHERI